MAKHIPNTELVFRDLKDIAVELQKECNSPLRVRRLLSQFITLLQQLTEVMRKECSDQIGKEWRASNFSGWNEVTVLFKKLRRTDYHPYPVTICVEETQYFAVGDIFEDGVGTSEVAVQGTWELGDPFSEHIPDGLSSYSPIPALGDRQTRLLSLGGDITSSSLMRGLRNLNKPCRR